MNKHDERRRNLTINALLRACKRLEDERIYLSRSDREIKDGAPMDELFKVHDALEHIGIALDRLTNNEEESTCSTV